MSTNKEKAIQNRVTALIEKAKAAEEEATRIRAKMSMYSNRSKPTYTQTYENRRGGSDKKRTRNKQRKQRKQRKTRKQRK